MLKIIYILLMLSGFGLALRAFSGQAENINQQMLFVLLGCFVLIMARLIQAEDMRANPGKPYKEQ